MAIRKGRVLQDRAANYFMLAIGKGWDEHGAHRLTAEKFGKQIADQVFSEARGIEQQIRGNPRGRWRYLDWKKQTQEAAEELEKKRKKSNPRFKNPNKVQIGKIIDDENNIEKMVVVEKGHPGRTNYRVFAEPTAKGKNTKAYTEIRHQLGDDWFSDITDSWFEPKALPKRMQEKIDKVIEELRAEGYTRY